MKRFALFSYDHYYPSGGWSDCIGTFDSVDEAKAAAPDRDCHEVVDLLAESRELAISTNGEGHKMLGTLVWDR